MPLQPFLMGIAGAVGLSLVFGIAFGPTDTEDCTRTREKRTTRNWGILCFSTIYENEESKIISDVLKFHPNEHNWVGGGDWHDLAPTFLYQSLSLTKADLYELAKLKPVEKCHSIFLLDNPLDCKFQLIRYKILLNLGKEGGNGTGEEIMEAWWKEYEPLLRPLRSNDDLKRGILDYRTGKNRYYDAELSPFARMVGLPP